MYSGLFTKHLENRSPFYIVNLSPNMHLVYIDIINLFLSSRLPLDCESFTYIDT